VSTSGSGKPKTPVYRITDARRGLSDDVHSREVRYLVSMGIRTVCFLLAIVVPYWPLRIVFFIGALVLPYLSVVFANAGREHAETLTANTLAPTERPKLEPGRHADDS
jgi:hypothetical protein